MIVAFPKQRARIRSLRMIMVDFRTKGSRLKKIELNLGVTVGFHIWKKCTISLKDVY